MDLATCTQHLQKYFALDWLVTLPVTNKVDKNWLITEEVGFLQYGKWISNWSVFQCSPLDLCKNPTTPGQVKSSNTAAEYIYDHHS